MAWILWFLGVIILVAIFFLSFGFYEYLVENKQDCKRRDLHLKHLDDINHDRK